MSRATDDAAAPPRPRGGGRHPLPLALFLAAVVGVGLPLGAWTVLRVPGTSSGVGTGLLASLVAVLVISELMPVEITRRGRAGDEITISSTFALALLFVAPLGIVVLAQAVPVVLDDLRRGKHWSRPLFNASHSALTLVASRAVFCTLTGKAFWEPSAFTAQDLPASFAAGAVFWLVNHLCVSTAIALQARQSVLLHACYDLRFELSTSGLLVSLAPLVVVASAFSIVLLPVLLLPIAAVRITAQLAAQRQHDALHDVLTALPNRALLHLRLEQALREATEVGGGVVVVMADLDHFKEINDTLGHDAGDLLLQQMAARLSVAAGPDVLVARLGGDEFALLLAPAGPAADCAAAATALVERMSAALKEPVTLAGVRLDVQASMGIALAPEHGTGITQLIARADVAMYAAKRDRGSWAFYDPDLDEHTPERLAMLAELRDGLDRGELTLHYQPKCEARSGEVVGVEALVRWQHPTRGLLMPDSFIPVAENTAVISLLTHVVLEDAVRQARTWLDAGRRLGIAVNLSVRQLTDLELPAQVAACLSRHGVPAELLTLEVTESTIMNDPSRAVAVLGGLRALGVRIAVDDYGTGYSSLAYLKRLAVDELKIDKSFIMGMRSDDDDATIVRSTIELGHNLGLQLVAEGVEDLATWQLLRPLGCDVLQGYYISRPLPIEQFNGWLHEWDRRRSSGSPRTRPPAPPPADSGAPAPAARTET